MKLSIALITVPKRLSFAEDVASRLSIKPVVFSDPEYRGVWWNAKRAWASATGDYHMVIQDDALPNDNNLIHRLLPLLDIIKDTCILSLFDTSNPSIQKAILRHKKGLLRTSRVTTAQAIIMSRTNVFRFLRWNLANVPDDIEINCDDERIALWQTRHSIPALFPFPYPITHTGQNSSLIGNKHVQRRVELPADDGSAYPEKIITIPAMRPGLRFMRSLEKRKR